MINITEVTERSVYNDRTPHHQNIILWLERGFFFSVFFSVCLATFGPVRASDLPLPSEGLGNTDKQRAHDESNGNFHTSRTSYASLMFPHVNPETSSHNMSNEYIGQEVCSLQ